MESKEDDEGGRDWRGEVREVRADLEEQREEGRRWREEGEQVGREVALVCVHIDNLVFPVEGPIGGV